MADENTTADTQAVSGDQSQADTTATESADSQAESTTETISLEEAKKLRSEAKSLRTRLKEAETKLTNYDNEKLTETQKLKKDLDEAKAASTSKDNALRNMMLQNKVAEVGPQLGARSTRALTKLLNTDALEFDLEKFEVSGVEDELKRLKKEEPDLFVTGGTDGGKGNEQRGRSFNMNDQIRRVAGRS